MISWSDCDARIGDHRNCIARAERVGWLESFPVGRRHRTGRADVVVRMQQGVDAVLARVGRRLQGSGQAVEAG